MVSGCLEMAPSLSALLSCQANQFDQIFFIDCSSSRTVIIHEIQIVTAVKKEIKLQ